MTKRKIVATALWALVSGAAHAEVTRFEVTQSVPAFEARSFGSVGPYVRITGRATIAVDPADRRNAVIADSTAHRATRPAAWRSSPTS